MKMQPFGQLIATTSERVQKNRRDSGGFLLFLFGFFLCRLDFLRSGFGICFGFFVGSMSSFLCFSFLCRLDGLLHHVNDHAPAIGATLGANAMHQMLCAAFCACLKTRPLESVVGTAIGRMSLGVSHVYYHSVVEYTQTKEKCKWGPQSRSLIKKHHPVSDDVLGF